jgi:hypothetical protein
MEKQERRALKGKAAVARVFTELRSRGGGRK